MENYFAMFVLIGVLVYQGVISYIERRAHFKERQDLYNRLMAKTFSEFAAGSAKMSQKPAEPETAKERIEKEKIEYDLQAGIMQVS